MAVLSVAISAGILLTGLQCAVLMWRRVSLVPIGGLLLLLNVVVGALQASLWTANWPATLFSGARAFHLATCLASAWLVPFLAVYVVATRELTVWATDRKIPPGSLQLVAYLSLCPSLLGLGVVVASSDLADVAEVRDGMPSLLPSAVTDGHHMLIVADKGGRVMMLGEGGTWEVMCQLDDPDVTFEWRRHSGTTRLLAHRTLGGEFELGVSGHGRAETGRHLTCDEGGGPRLRPVPESTHPDVSVKNEGVEGWGPTLVDRRGHGDWPLFVFMPGFVSGATRYWQLDDGLVVLLLEQRLIALDVRRSLAWVCLDATDAVLAEVRD